MRRNIFEQNSSEDNSSVTKDNEIARKVNSKMGHPCIVKGCRCVCQHYHEDTNGNFEYTNVVETHAHCPIDVHKVEPKYE